MACLRLAQAQDANSAYPGGPALNRADDFSAWTITCQAAGSQGAPATPNGTAQTPALPPLPFVQMSVIKTKNLRSVDSTNAAGQKTVRFFIGALESYTPPGTTTARYLGGEESRMPGAYINFSRSDFPECVWISPANFSGIRTVPGHKCLYFHTPKSEAYVDLQSRLPVSNQVDGLLYNYQFLPPPTAMLSVPQLMQARIDFESERTKALTAHASRTDASKHGISAE